MSPDTIAAIEALTIVAKWWAVYLCARLFFAWREEKQKKIIWAAIDDALMHIAERDRIQDQRKEILDARSRQLDILATNIMHRSVQLQMRDRVVPREGAIWN